MKKKIAAIGAGLIAGAAVIAGAPAASATSIAVAIQAEAKVTVSKASVEANHPIAMTVRAGHSHRGKHNLGKSWKAPKGFKQPKGWAVFNGGATFKPCSTVKWHYDSKGEPENSSLMIQTIRESFDLISERTGLKFVEKKKKVKRSENRINLDWKWNYGSGLAYGGGYGYDSGDGEVSFNPTEIEYYADTRAGHDVLAGDDVLLAYSGYPTKTNGWTVVHEVLHALGMGHVKGSSVMNRISGFEFSDGDLAGMREMYLDNPC